jgi:hypothetical protein
MNRPSGFWRETIISALRSYGGQAHLSPEINEWVRQNIDLTEKELSESPHQGRPYYYNTVRGIANDMADQGLLVRISAGYFRLT